MSCPGWARLGQAVTHGQALPLDVDDPVLAARAVRRALAAAGRRAIDVQALTIASSTPIAPDASARFARRALGPHGAALDVTALEIPETDADALADHAARLLEATDPMASGVGIAVGLGTDGTTVALCLGLAALPSGS